MSGLLLVERRDDLAFVTLNDPERANALSPAPADGLVATYRRDWRAEGVRAILVSGAGKSFCAGADLENLARLADASPLDHRLDSQRLRDLFDAVLRQEALTLALVHGACVAGGCGLATACDFVLASDDARFLYSEVKIGFVAALVATFLPLRVKGADLRELLLAPELVDARRAGELGVDRGEQAAAPRDARPRARRAARPGGRGQRRGAPDRRLPARRGALSRPQEDARLARVRLFLFDVDGTLVHSSRQARPAFAEALVEVFGTAGAIDDYDFSGKTDARIVVDLAVGAGIDERKARAALSRVREIYVERFARIFDPARARILPGVEALLAALAARDDVARRARGGGCDLGGR